MTYILKIKDQAEYKRLRDEYNYFELTLVPRGDDYYTVERMISKEEKEKLSKVPQRYKNKLKRNTYYDEDE